MNYLLGTGYFQNKVDKFTAAQKDAAEFFKTWCDNNARFLDPKPREIVCIAVAGYSPPKIDGVQTVAFSGHLGHGTEVMTRRNFFMGGGASVIMTLCMLAYTAECDLIYKGQSCLAFGPWVKKLYEEAENKRCLFGSCQIMGASSSLMLVKHSFIPHFVRDYLAMGEEYEFDNLTERKLARMQQKFPEPFGRMSFGFDRDRPYNLDAPVFYVQHVTPEDLEAMKTKGLA